MIALGLGTFVFIGAVLFIYETDFAPVDHAGFFCGVANTSDLPGPVPSQDLATATVLRECSAGAPVVIRRGETIAVDLQNLYGVDGSSVWQNVGVSDTSVLVTVTRSSPIGVPAPRDEIVIYRGLRVGQSTISAVLFDCTTNFGGHCDQGRRWSVNIRVT